MSWKHKGVEIEIGGDGKFHASIIKDKQTHEVSAGSLEAIHPLIEKALARSKKDDLDLHCLAYQGHTSDIVEVRAIGISGTDSSFRLTPKLTGAVTLYPSHPTVRLLLEQLRDIQADMAKLTAKLKPLEIHALGYGRQDLATMEVLSEKLTQRYMDALKAIEDL